MIKIHTDVKMERTLRHSSPEPKKKIQVTHTHTHKTQN